MYKLKKGQLYQNLEDLSNVLNEYETVLGRGNTGATKDTMLEQMKSITANLANHDKSVSALKILANETLLHCGAAHDPGNSIKADLYAFCAQWDGLESKLSESSRVVVGKKVATEIKLREASKMESDIKQMKKNGGQENQITVAETLLDKLKTHQESIEGVTLWMDEVSTFLVAEDAPFGDVANLETQLKDSNALLEDIKQLKSKLGAINTGGLELCSKCEELAFQTKLQHELESINSKWNEVESLAERQNTRLRSTYNRSQKLANSLNELQIFVAQLKKDLPENTPVKKPADLSQRTFKLLHFKDKIERKRAIFESLISLRESSELMSSPSTIVAKIHQLELDWKEKCQPVIENYKQMKVASTGLTITTYLLQGPSID